MLRTDMVSDMTLLMITISSILKIRMIRVRTFIPKRHVYTFPKEWMKVAFIQNARVYLSGENLLTITKFEGSDPERMAGDGYMPIRQYTVGVNVTF